MLYNVILLVNIKFNLDLLIDVAILRIMFLEPKSSVTVTDTVTDSQSVAVTDWYNSGDLLTSDIGGTYADLKFHLPPKVFVKLFGQGNCNIRNESNAYEGRWDIYAQKYIGSLDECYRMS